MIRWIAFGLSIATAFLAFWMVVPAPTYFLLTFGVGAREISAWLILSSALAVRLAVPSIRESRISQAAIVLCIASFVIAVSPFVRMPAVIDRFNEQTRLISTEPRVPMRPRPIVIADLFRGIERQPVKITRNITFAVPGTRLALDIYQPVDSLAPGARPVLHPIIVQIYGGAWQRGAPADNGDFAEWAANAGYVVFAIDYRHAPLFRWPAQLQDVDSALVWIGDHAAKYGGDASRVVLMGRSAGGHIALMAAYSSPPIPISGVISYYGPTELPDSYRHPPHPDPLRVRSNMEALLGGPLDAMPDRYIAASPTSLAGRMQPPTLLIYGAADHIVEAKYGALLRDKLKASGTQVAYLEIPWAEHAFDAVFQGPSSQLALYYVERFLAMTTIRSESLP